MVSDEKPTENFESVTEEEIDEGLEKVEKTLDKEIKKESIIVKFSRHVVVRSTIFMLIVFFFLAGLYEYTPFVYTPSADINRSFIVETCYIQDAFPCKLSLNGNKASFEIESEKYILTKADFSMCAEHTAPENNTLIFSECKFSPISNSREITTHLLNPKNGLIFTEKGRIVKLIEITKMKTLFSEIFGK